MFSLQAGKSAYPQVYSLNTTKKGSKKDSASKSSKPKKDLTPNVATLGPAIDGPPSPERIRAYTEQMRRGSIFGNSSRSNTFSSTTPSFRSRESISAGNDTANLSRKSSGRSNHSSMAPLKSDRPDSVQIFGSIFSRSGRKSRKSSNARSTGSVTGTSIEEEHTKEGSETYEAARRHHISTPYNFQHITHTQQQHLTSIENNGDMVAMRSPHSPGRGESNGIRSQGLHFENFSSESLSSPTPTTSVPPPISPKNPRRQNSLRSATSGRLVTSQSQDNLRSAPVRPPRSPPSPISPVSPHSSYFSYSPHAPLSPVCPVPPPARTSSRTASILFDKFDPLAVTTLERPQTDGGFRQPAPFSPSAPPPPPSWSETDNYFSRTIQHAVTTPGDEAWPLSNSGIFGGELADVEEEDENVSRLSKISISSNDLRSSMSVPALRLRSLEREAPQKIADQSEMAFQAESSTTQRTFLPPTFHGLRDSWEDDVDFCYENEIEANFDYEWDCDADNSEKTPPAFAPELHLHLDKENQITYHGRFRPSLLVPSTSGTPELSPLSDNSLATSEPRTPAQPLRPTSNGSVFKESHGFHLSPTLLIPNDFREQMHQENNYDDQFMHATSSALFSTVDDSIYSNSSYRSSGFSRQSARDSSSTRISTVNSRGSQDSGILISRAASVSKAHRSVNSDTSLHELIPATLRNDMSSDSLASMNIPIPEQPSELAMSADVANLITSHRRNKSSGGEPGSRKGANHFAPTSASTDVLEVKSLSPVAETFVELAETTAPKGERPQIHGRKTSVPLAGIDNAKFKSRARAATASAVGGKARGSYALFPTIV